MNTFKYTRNGESFEISPNGIRYFNKQGDLLTPGLADIPLPDDVIASTVVELALAGWTPVNVASAVLD